MIDLSYDDPLAPSIPVEVVIVRGRRVRVRRRIVAAAAACLVLAAVAIGATVSTGVFRGSSAPAHPGDIVARELAALHPAGTPLVMLDQPHDGGWQEFVYVDGNGDVGGGFIQVSGPQPGFLEAETLQSPPDASDPGTMTKPIFQANAEPFDTQLAIGLVPAGVTRVAVTFKGTTTVASVTTVVAGPHGFGAYAAFLPMHGDHSSNSYEITSVVATNANGRIIAEIS